MHSPFLTLKGTGSMSQHLRNCKSLKECRAQKRRRYDAAKRTSALAHLEDTIEKGEGNDGDSSDESEDNDDAQDVDYQP